MGLKFIGSTGEACGKWVASILSDKCSVDKRSSAFDGSPMDKSPLLAAGTLEGDSFLAVIGVRDFCAVADGADTGMKTFLVEWCELP